MDCQQRAVPIFAYHRVHADNDPLMPKVRTDLFSGHVTESEFRKQMAALADRGFTTVCHDQLAQWLYEGQPLPEGKVAAIGFDDNRLNVLENALPVMTDYGFKATVWVISRLADGNLPDYETYPWLNWDQLAELHEQGWEIGAHTATHPFAPWIIRGTSGPDGTQRYVDDLVECNDSIERHLGFAPQHFAYPGGEWNDEAEALIVRLYKTARHWECDDRPYHHNTWQTNPYRLQAINVSMHMPFERFVQLLDGAQ
jgi:peptidoglycan/xylan/chitin deacetylase (PgdA/CDA1 family)